MKSAEIKTLDYRMDDLNLVSFSIIPVFSRFLTDRQEQPVCFKEQSDLGLYEPHHEKTNILVADLVRHKQGCTATEDG